MVCEDKMLKLFYTSEVSAQNTNMGKFEKFLHSTFDFDLKWNLIQCIFIQLCSLSN